MKAAPEFAVFACSAEELSLFARAGADRAVLDVPGFCARNFGPAPDRGAPDAFRTLCACARELGLEITLNIDFLERDLDRDLFAFMLELCRGLGVSSFRVQSPGVGAFVIQRLPGASVCLASETGNANSESVGFFFSHAGFDTQTLSPLLSAAELGAVVANVPSCAFELQVFGRVLLHQSARFILYMSALEMEAGSCERVLAQPGRTQQIPKEPCSHDAPVSRRGLPVCRSLPAAWRVTGAPDVLRTRAIEANGRGLRLEFVENRTGTFIYAPVLFSLASVFPALCALNLDCWLFDGRMLDPARVALALEHFRALRRSLDSGRADAVFGDLPGYVLGDEVFCGFFGSGFVEEGRFAAPAAADGAALGQGRVIGRVVDVVAERCVSIDVMPGAALSEGAGVVFSSPNRIAPIAERVRGLRHASGLPAASVAGPAIAVCGWHKGVVAGTLVSEAVS